MRSESDKGQRLLRIYQAKERGDSDYLVKALTDSELRDAAVRALGDVGDPIAIEPLMPLLDARDPQVRAAAADSLGKLQAKGAVSRLIDIAENDSEVWVAEWAMNSLGAIGDPSAIRPLVELLSDCRRRVRRGAAIVLGRLGDPSVVNEIARARKKDYWFARRLYREAEQSLSMSASAPRHGRGDSPGTLR